MNNRTVYFETPYNHDTRCHKLHTHTHTHTHTHAHPPTHTHTHAHTQTQTHIAIKTAIFINSMYLNGARDVNKYLYRSHEQLK